MEYFYLFMFYFETFKDMNKFEVKNNCNFDHFYLFKLHIKFKNLIILNFGSFKILNSKFQNSKFLLNFENFKIQDSRFNDVIKYKFILTLTKLNNILTIIYVIRPNTKIAYHFCIRIDRVHSGFDYTFKLFKLICFIYIVCKIVNYILISLNFKLSMMDNLLIHMIFHNFILSDFKIQKQIIFSK